MAKRMNKKTMRTLAGVGALAALGYVAWRAAKPATATTTTGGTGTTTGGGTTAGSTDLPYLYQATSYNQPVFQGFTLGQDLQNYLTGSALTLTPVYGFTRIGLEQPTYVLKGTGFTLL